jgi:hypothetical protein
MVLVVPSASSSCVTPGFLLLSILLTGVRTAQRYPNPLRHIHYFDAERDSRLTFLPTILRYPPLILRNCVGPVGR